MKLATRYILVLFLGMFVGAAIILDMGVLAEREAGKEAPAPLPLDELRTFTEVFSRIKADYVEPVEDKKLLEDAVQGMLAGLDPHSAYLDSESFRDMRVETEGQFGGLGIEVTMENGFVKVVSPIEDTPAARGGVKPGDLVIRLDDKAVKGMTLTEAVRVMRNNPGGVLNAAVGVSDAFLDKGLIVYTEGRVADSKMKLSATPGDLLNGTPIVVLINGGSASASEIVACALQDHKRAVIMGTKSFGKGSVQTIVPISNGAALKITTARYFTPNGRSIQALGIVPDIVTEEAKLTKSEAGDRLKEADLARHLENGDEMTKPKEEPKKEGKKDDKKKDETGKAPAVEDYQLQEALNLLKGISFFRAQSN